jgi:hypothetical protein
MQTDGPGCESSRVRRSMSGIGLYQPMKYISRINGNGTPSISSPSQRMAISLDASGQGASGASAHQPQDGRNGEGDQRDDEDDLGG